MLSLFALLTTPLSAAAPLSPSQVEWTPQDPSLGRPVALSERLLMSQAKPQSPSALGRFLVPKTIRSLPGELDEIPVFNSNNPEVIRQPGILLSTFPDEGMKYPEAHLNYSFEGRFDLFSHHIAKSDYPDYTSTLYLGVLIKNASSKRKNVVDILQAASFLGTPDAPYVALPPVSPNDVGRIYSGPGDRVSDVILRGIRQAPWPPQLELDPNESVMLMNLPVPLPTPGKRIPLGGKIGRRVIKSSVGAYASGRKKSPSSNARSTLLRMKAKREVYIASMAMYAPINSKGEERVPTLSDWQALLQSGRLVQPRDLPPSELDSDAEKFYYGRVSGVSRGSEWSTQVTDDRKSDQLTIPEPGQAISFGISTLQRGTFGTEQIQSAPMVVRYPDTAYLAHGNYGVHYKLTLPLYNDTGAPQTVKLSFQTPVKDDESNEGLSFYRNPPDSIFFRGTVRLKYRDDSGSSRVQYFHLVHRQGEQSSPLLTLNLGANESRLVSLDFVYPPDATPPQVVTVSTENRREIAAE